jgi:hypothetical protein
MTSDSTPPDFQAFTRWVASRFAVRAENRKPPENLVAAARAARDATLSATRAAQPNLSTSGGGRRQIEILQLLAAASMDEGSRLPELSTPRGFRVTLAYDERLGAIGSSIGVLVQCPPNLIEQVQGQTAYLWNGDERLVLGQFDSDGKAIGTLPVGTEITLSDFKSGKVKLEESDLATDD